ncbi:MAG: cysteine desulfurase [Treponema sp.]|nr:cysteine desulfurase [Treponema sp.]
MTTIDSHKYFDWAATAPFDTELLSQSLEESFAAWGNPSSIYKTGTTAKEALNNARSLCAKTLGVKPENIFFTSGGTESDHIPLLSILNRPEKHGRIIVSAIEHPAIREQSLMLKKMGYDVVSVNPDKNGIIQPQSITDLIDADTLYVTVMAVNNETGAISNVKEIAKAITEKSAGKRKPKFHVDFVQALGKIPVELAGTDIDSAAFSAHKIGGPRGIGILYLKNPVEPFLRGGGQEQNIRSGTENVFGALAFSKAIEKYAITKNNNQDRFELQQELTASFIEKLSGLSKCTVIPETRTDKSFAEKNYSPWVLQAAFDKIPGQVMVRALDSKGFSISTGSACSARKNSRPILEAMGTNPKLQENAVRFSFGHWTTKEDMDALFEAVKEVCSMF